MNTNETHPYASQVNRLLALLTQSGFALNSVYDGGETIPTLSIDAAASNILGVDESTLYVTHPERKSSLALYIVLGNGAGELVSDWTSWDKLNSLLDSYSEAEQMSREEVLEFIRSNDANGYETLEGDETLDQLLDAQLSIKSSGGPSPAALRKGAAILTNDAIEATAKELADHAANHAIAFIQSKLGITDGDFAGASFTGSRPWAELKKILADYATAELLRAKLTALVSE